jgi:hypothetical protein
MRLTTIGALLALLACGRARAAAPPSIEEKTRGLEKADGLLPLYWDTLNGKIFLEIPKPGEDLLYAASLPAGIGSNDILLDRGQWGPLRVVRFERSGPKVLLVEPNLQYRSEKGSPQERRAVEESFARSVLWGFTVEAETGDRTLVDATAFALHDAHGVARRLKEVQQGTYKVDDTRSMLYAPRTKSFPDNTELEATLTFVTTDPPGAWVTSVTPSADSVTVREHHSFVRLPPAGYSPRVWQPGCGAIPLTFQDYSQPLGESLTRRYVLRYRLQRKDAASSEPVKPIVYYIDRGAPEPVRTALREGASWWAQAFEAAGFKNAYRVEWLPDDADPMDVRLNVVEWVHRSTRGWSYGNPIADPRTGEILNGHVSLGSLRVRQDFLIGEALLAPYAQGADGAGDVLGMALARIRQLAAHEVGHALGFAHNFVASTEGRASVMDYPHPLIEIGKDGAPDVQNAYAKGIGAWDKVAVDYSYREYASGTEEPAALDQLLASARSRGLTFITDEDARPAGGAHPQAHLWDNGEDASAELLRVLKVRRVALERFGESAIKRGRPLATLEEGLVPLYLYHRYQAEACAKLVGGVSYGYALRGDGQAPPKVVPAEAQRRALAALLATLEPATLALPRPLLAILPPRPPAYEFGAELFPRFTGLAFDSVSPAMSAARITLAVLLHPQRAARLVEQRAFDSGQLSLDEVLTKLVEASFQAPPPDAYQAEIHRGVARVLVDAIAQLTEAPMPQVGALARARLEALGDQIRRAPSTDPLEEAHRRLIAEEIKRHLERPLPPLAIAPPKEPPPGAPIGELEDEE